MGEAAALGTALCWSFTALFFSYSGRRVGSEVVNLSRLLFALVLLAATHLVVTGSLLPLDAEPRRWGWLGLSSLLGLVIGDSALFEAFVLLGPRLAMLLMSLAPILATLLAWPLLGETVSPTELAGILLTVGGVSWVVGEARPGREPGAGPGSHFGRGVAFGLVGALGQASNLVVAKFGLAGGYSTLSATFIRILVAVVVLWALAGWRGRIGRTAGAWRDRRALRALAGGTLVGPYLGIWLSLLAVREARVGIASTLMALPPVILIPLELVVFGTRVSRRGVVGTVLAVVGVAVLFLAP